MGYRSDVGIMVNDKHAEEFSKIIDPLVGSETEIYKTEDGLIKGIVFEDIKWYASSDDQIREVEEFLENLPDEDYGLIYIGEESSDVRIDGCPYDYGLGFIRKIEIDQN